MTDRSGETTTMRDIYTEGSYLNENPTWHEEDSPWKASQILRMLDRHQLPIQSVAEIGCGVGGVLSALRDNLPGNIEFDGFDIAPAAIARAKEKERERLRFHQEDLLQSDVSFDLLLVIDVFEHVPDYYGFLEGCRRKAKFKLYHIPLQLSVDSLLRRTFAHGRPSGHIHYFTEESALATLERTGHKIIDFFHTNCGVGVAHLHPSIRRTLINIPRRLISLVSVGWACRLVGGYSLLVLAE